MDGWMDERIDEWMDELNGWAHGQTNEWVCPLITTDYKTVSNFIKVDIKKKNTAFFTREEGKKKY